MICLKREKYTYIVSENELKILNNLSSDVAILIKKNRFINLILRLFKINRIWIFKGVIK